MITEGRFVVFPNYKRFCKYYYTNGIVGLWLWIAVKPGQRRTFDGASLALHKLSLIATYHRLVWFNNSSASPCGPITGQMEKQVTIVASALP